jgi:hypothetical protein
MSRLFVEPQKLAEEIVVLHGEDHRYVIRSASVRARSSSRSRRAARRPRPSAR